MRQLRRRVAGRPLTAAIAALLASGCGGKNTDTPSTPSGGAVDWTVSGTVVSNPAGLPVAGAAISVIGGTAVLANASGLFSISGSGTQAIGVRISISAPGYLKRDTSIQAGANRSGLVIDLIQDAPPFSLSFYRELVRGSIDGGIRTTRRWHQDPSFYIQTIDENGADVQKFFVDSAISVIPDIVADATAGRFRAARIETGASTDPPSFGTIVIRFPAASFGGAGVASGIGVNPCAVRVWQGDVPSAVTKVIAHEIGHCLGLSHITVTGLPPTPQGLMGKFGYGSLPGPRLTDAEKFHAAILYSRPDGNADLDIDPNSWLFTVIR
jgi:hypothetical protein